MASPVLATLPDERLTEAARSPEPRQTSPRPSPFARPERAAPTIVVVEDDVPSRRSIARGLRARGYRVLGAADGVEALQLVERHGADAVVTDIFMPNMDGLDLILNLVLDRPTLPVLAFTGAPRSNPSVRSAIIYGAREVLSKPFDTADLARLLDSALGR